jgi:starch-binding outer membrane protein, SusD/RagB family
MKWDKNVYYQSMHSEDRSIAYSFLGILLIITGFSCKKIIDIAEPRSSITTAKTFDNDGNAISAVMAIYSDLSFSKNGIYFSSGSTTICAGLYADELRHFNGINSFYSNNLKLNDTYGEFWAPAYSNIYAANAVLEGLHASSKISFPLKDQLRGEALFLRALAYFYLINFFGDVPLVTTTDFTISSLQERTSSEIIYQQVVSDLKEAYDLLPVDYLLLGGKRIRASKWAAAALLARVYLYIGDWVNAEAQATSIINNIALFGLNNINDVFLKNNKEAILQLECITQSNFQFATQEGFSFNPPNRTSAPKYFLNPQLLVSFAPGDQRRKLWVDSTIVSSTTYYVPYKYKNRQATAGNNTEFNTIFRVAEQYLIRAEARARQNTLNGAVDDLNVIRARAKLSPLSSSLNQSQVITAVIQERRVELFAEWGHRWFDLKRTGQATTVLSLLKGSDWQSTDELWPIPQSELLTNPNLIQNPGYN